MRYIKQWMFIFALSSCAVLSGCQDTSKNNDQTEKKEETTKVTVQENDTYWAPINPTSYIAKTYDEVSASLNKSDEEQAQAVAKAFIADFFTLSNKDNDGDIGGLDYIPSTSNEAFQEYAKYYYYNNYAIILTNEGKDALPQVENITLSNVKPETVTYMDKQYDGYTMDANIEYVKASDASDFKTSAKCTIIKMQDIHYVSNADVTTDKESGEPKDVYRIIAVE